ncbi:hypothetical protein BJ508DRAFT_331734 [Ascobolus immersus RN42]|uniref:PNPLA domain-containing protein n=1 Tax=Ascobolus immersus RN42 TaxID=1160509 RepID=A0A3N4HPS4_ASCIM|nr:hypothetical protein BJ508DRAFT_331734 [Ascobolus immersus RN42]
MDKDDKSCGMNPLDTKGLCLLSLDGGGVRGLSTLYILKDIMDRVNRELAEREGVGKRVVKPCDVFDLIAGTSTGGLIAIMLGRLKMDVDQCIKEYESLMDVVFGKRRSRLPVSFRGDTKARFDAKSLQKAVQDVIRRQGQGVDDLLNDKGGSGCRVFVCATAASGSMVVRLRSYDSPIHDPVAPKGVKIYEAALATAAAPSFFDRVALDGSKYVDGALGANNPIEELESEARKIWCGGSDLSQGLSLEGLSKCIVSLGTGKSAHNAKDIKEDIIGLTKTLVKMTTSTDPAEARFRDRWSGHFDEGRAFRFTVRRGLEGVKLHEFGKRSAMIDVTKRYLHDHDVRRDLESCARNLALKQGKADLRLSKTIKDYNLMLQSSVTLVSPSSPPQQIPGICLALGKHTDYTSDGSSSPKPLPPLEKVEVKRYQSIPLMRNENFTGREDTLQALDGMLFKDRFQSRMAIFALGGCGKTQVALEFAWRVLEQYADCSVFWVVVTSSDSINQGYESIARRLGIRSEPGCDIKILVKEYLDGSAFEGRCLLVFDNVDDSKLWEGDKSKPVGIGREGLKRYVPVNRKCSVLVTTRFEKIATAITSTTVNQVSLPPLEQSAAIDMLQKLLPDKLKKEVGWDLRLGELCEKLTYLPLAITQAASFMANTDNVDIAYYIEALDGKSEEDTYELLNEDFEDKGRYEEIENSIASTWLISFERLEKDEPHAALILKTISFLDHKNIPRQLFPAGPSILKQEKAIAALTGYSFLTKRENGNYDMHRLVHLVTNNWVRQSLGSDISVEIENFYTMLDDQIPSISKIVELEAETRMLYTGHLRHVVAGIPGHNWQNIAEQNDVASIYLKLRLVTYLSLFSNDNYGYGSLEMEALSRPLYESSTEILGPEHVVTLGCLYSYILSSCHVAGSFQELSPSMKQSLLTENGFVRSPQEMTDLARFYVQLQERVHGKGSDLYTEALRLLSNCLRHLSQNESDAEKLLRDAIEGFNSPKKDSALTVQYLRSKQDLTSLLRAQGGRDEEALSILKELAPEMEEFYGLHNSATLRVYIKLFLTLSRLKRDEEAWELAKSNEIDPHLVRRVFGLTSDTAMEFTSEIYACIFRVTADYVEGERIARESVMEYKQCLGNEHWRTLESSSFLAAFIYKQGRIAEAEALQRETLEVQERVLGPLERDSLDTARCLIDSLFSLRKLDDAFAGFREKYYPLLQTSGLDPQSSSELLSILGQLFFGLWRTWDTDWNTGRTLEERDDVCQMYLKAELSRPDPSPWDRARAMRYHSLVLHRKPNGHDDSLNVLREAVELVREVDTKDVPPEIRFWNEPNDKLLLVMSAEIEEWEAFMCPDYCVLDQPLPSVEALFLLHQIPGNP